MGIGDSIGKAAENAMEDLAGTSEPTDDAHVPEPGAKDDDIQVHSSISEGSNAMDDDDSPAGAGTGRTGSSQGTGTAAGGGAGTGGAAADSTAGTAAEGDTGTGTGIQDAGGIGAAEGSGTPGHVAGSAGLPDPDPDELRADPSEADQDPTTGLGRS
ncbi:MAG: hypothetical protein K0S72_370 [Arthrobacter sp.]|nr:hypothetical protein [Arthrobacter sp.]